MDALTIFKDLLSLGTVFYVNEDGRLAYEAPHGVMTAERIACLRNHREELLPLVGKMGERAAVMEVDGGLTREEATHLAREEVLEAVSKHLVTLCPYCSCDRIIDEPNGCRCIACNRLAWVLDGLSIVRVDVRHMNLHA